MCQLFSALILICLNYSLSKTVSFRVPILILDETKLLRNNNVAQNAAEDALHFIALPPQIQITLTYHYVSASDLEEEDRRSVSEIDGGLATLYKSIISTTTNTLLVGSVSDDMCKAAAVLASVMKTPFVSWSCQHELLSNVDVFSRTIPSSSDVVKAMLTAVHFFKWKYTVIISVDTGHWRHLTQQLDISLRRRGFIVQNFILLQPDAEISEVTESLRTIIQPPVKVIFLMMDIALPLITSVLTAASQLGFTDNQKYAWICSNVLNTLHPKSVPKNLQPEVLNSILLFTFVPPNISYTDLWESDEIYSQFENLTSKFSQFGAYAYQSIFDATSLMFHAVKRSVAASASSRQLTVSETTNEANCTGLLGPVLTDKNGDRKVDFVTLYYHKTRKEFVEYFTVTSSVNSLIKVRNMSNYKNIYKNGQNVYILQKLMEMKVVPPPDPHCIFSGTSCSADKEITADDNQVIGSTEIAVAVSSLVMLFLFIGIIFIIIRNWMKIKEMTRGPFKILLTSDDIVYDISVNKSIAHQFQTGESAKPDLIRGSFETLRPRTCSCLSVKPEDQVNSARYNGDLVFLHYLNEISNFEVRNKALHHLRLMHDLRQENINPFLGLMTSPVQPMTVWEMCTRGSLMDIINRDDLKLDWSFKLSLLTDLVKGMRYLHNSAVKYHGRLSSRNCVVDSRWVLKITDYGIPRLYESQGQIPPQRDFSELLWTAPELLRNEFFMRKGSSSGDIFSFAIILQEIILRCPPYYMLSLQPEEIISKLVNPPPLIRPSVSKQAAPPEVINIMKQCWAENPDMRPDFNFVHEQFKSFNQGKKGNIVDTMFQLLEKYSNNLEDLIRERTLQLDEEKKKTDQLLARMLPESVAESLKLGHQIEPENFEEVTIYFSDIVGFTTISAHSEPVEVVDLLNDLYTTFDATINHYNVYKVETIGDAYMVVGGLPERISDHAEQVATMALDLLHVCGKFKVRHLPKMPLRLRIGLHTGSCAAGVVGLTMPRYCLFGDTVNTASRMESTGSAFRIHVSSTTAEKLREAGVYHLVYRGEIELKGKGKHPSFWLSGKDGFDKQLPVPPQEDGVNDELLKYLERAPKSEKKQVHNSPNKSFVSLSSNRRFSCDAIQSRPLSATRLNYISPIVMISSPKFSKEPTIDSCTPSKGRHQNKKHISPSRMFSLESCENRVSPELSLTPDSFVKAVVNLDGSIASLGSIQSGFSISDRNDH